MGSPLEILRSAPAAVNPALDMAWTLKQRELVEGKLDMWLLISMADDIDAAQTAGKRLAAETDAALRRLKSASPAPSSVVPPGF